MKRTWNLREELYKTMHHWPTMIAMFALGCILGAALSTIWPSPYRAISEIYVALNPYRTYSDTTFLALTKPKYSNLDNYLFWQMAQLEEAAYLDQFIQQTIKELQLIDPYWENITEDQFREMLEVDWRAAGKWSLIVQNADANHAEQAVKTWSKVVKEGTDDAILSAKNTFLIDQELQSITTERLQSELREEELQRTLILISDWVDSTQDTHPDQPLNPGARWNLLNMITLPAQFTPSWQTILQQQPLPDSLLEDYILWIDHVSITIESELVSLEQKIASLKTKHSQLVDQYSYEANNSLGLSPNLAIEEVVYHTPKLVLPISTFALIGGIIGLLIWVLFQLYLITKNTKNSE